MPSTLDRRTLLLLGGSLAASGALATPAVAEAAPSRARRASAADIFDRAWVAPDGTRSTYHLFVSSVAGATRGLAVYLDGDGMYGHDHPWSTWALGGRRGVVAQAGARGYATLSIRTPSADDTFWTRGTVNAAYVATLTRRVAVQLGVSDVWPVGYSGGSQLITKFLLPGHGTQIRLGGAVITGGGGAPRRSAPMSVRSDVPLLWYTGSLDDGRGTDDDYDALADAKRGAAWYRARGANVSRVEPGGLDHEDLGGRFGAVLAGQLDRYR